jgi:hypothetical protein
MNLPVARELGMSGLPGAGVAIDRELAVGVPVAGEVPTLLEAPLRAASGPPVPAPTGTPMGAPPP